MTDAAHACWYCKDADPAVCLANPAHPSYNKGLIFFPERVAKPGCPFCDIVAGEAPATIVREWDDVIAIVPHNPVVEGHTLVIPKTHVEDFAAAEYVAARTMSKASMLAHRMRGPMNLITSKGAEATQSVFHLHIHLVPRAENDGLALPWYSGRSRKTTVSVTGKQADATEVGRSVGRAVRAARRRETGH
ncbi:HIT family protein [Streptomyces sp. NPDC058295]|uniref:HIT family protein n=1 Tax=Streptomyces sp. NPDC058295 TaxID=3346431 RepID=UPI0036F0B983